MVIAVTPAGIRDFYTLDITALFAVPNDEIYSNHIFAVKGRIRECFARDYDSPCIINIEDTVLGNIVQFQLPFCSISNIEEYVFGKTKDEREKEKLNWQGVLKNKSVVIIGGQDGYYGITRLPEEYA